MYRQALMLQPDFVAAHYNLGVTLYDQGRLEEAGTHFRQVLVLQPDYAEAHCNLGNIFMAQGKLQEAAACYGRTIALQPDHADTHYNLGTVFMVQGKFDEAAASFKRTLALQPDFAEAHCNLGSALNALGKMKEAVACFRKALALHPGYARAYKALALTVKFTEVDDVVLAMEDLFNKRGRISASDRIDLGFALGKAFEDLRMYDRSFACILEANRLTRQTFAYAIETDRDFINRIKETFSAAFFQAHAGSGEPGRLPIFIIGMPRSGTTLVEQILASHPLVFGAGELELLREVINATCTAEGARRFPEGMRDLDKDALAGMGKSYIKEMRKIAADARYITDKMPYNFLRVGVIKSILPKAKVVHCVRDPMDNCWSIFKNDFRGMHGYAYDLAELGQYYTLYRDLMLHWEKTLPGFMYTLNYEEMVADQENQTRKLLDFCGLPWDEACMAFHKTRRGVSTVSLAQVRKPLYRDSVALWKRYEKDLEPLRKVIYG